MKMCIRDSFVTANTVTFAGKGRIAGKQCNLAVSIFQKGFCDGIYGAIIVKAEEIHIQVVRTPLQKNGGDSEVSDSIQKKVCVLWLTGNDNQSGNILTDKIFDFFPFNIRQAVGKGDIDRVAPPLEISRNTFENLSVVDIVNVREHYTNPVGACGTQISGEMCIRDSIYDGQVKMAHLAIVAGFSVNGVARLHTEILKNQELRDFYEMMPEKFNNKTNGITQRRFLLHGNQLLANWITRCV